jgi:hypothetical protein
MRPVNETTEFLAKAAAKLRSVMNQIPPNDWDGAPWQRESCGQLKYKYCPCIVSQGSHPVTDEDYDNLPDIQYIADAETPELASYIALMHPGVGEALADWLDDVVEQRRRHVENDTATHMTWLLVKQTRRAMRVSRQILGESDG